MLDDVLVALLDPPVDKGRGGAHAVGAFIADAASIFDHVVRIGTLAVKNGGQIADPGQLGWIQGWICLGIGEKFDLHKGLQFQ